MCRSSREIFTYISGVEIRSIHRKETNPLRASVCNPLSKRILDMLFTWTKRFDSAAVDFENSFPHEYILFCFRSWNLPLHHIQVVIIFFSHLLSARTHQLGWQINATHYTLIRIFCCLSLGMVVDKYGNYDYLCCFFKCLTLRCFLLFFLCICIKPIQMPLFVSLSQLSHFTHSWRTILYFVW